MESKLWEKNVGIGLVNLLEVINALLTNRVLHAFEPNNCNLQCLFKYFLKKYRNTFTILNAPPSSLLDPKRVQLC
jgi:hypothetical protein